MSTQIVSHGNSELWYALPDGRGGFTEPKRFHGLGSTETEAENESETIYKDDLAYYTAEGETTFTLTINVAQIPKEFAVECLGWKETQEGGYSLSGRTKPCCLMVKNKLLDGVTGEETSQLTIYYNALPGEPKLESETDEDKISETEIEIEFNCTPHSVIKSPTGRNFAMAVIERSKQNAAFFDSYVTKVPVPTVAATMDFKPIKKESGSKAKGGAK